MAEKISWTLKAQADRKRILLYWKNRNGSDAYSRKLNNLFIEAVRLIGEFPQMGKRTDDEKARLKIVRDYFIVYEESEEGIVVLRIWDYRQNPKDLKLGK